jgi:glutathione S-transferase
MVHEIGLTDVRIQYASLEEARKMSGLRLILGSIAVPGPWREACKEIFHIKKIPYTPVAAAGKDGSDRQLFEWTAQRSAPVAIWNDERPRSTWIEQLYLAERLQPTPSLIPSNIEDRTLMFGHVNEICGENGFAWSKRLAMIQGIVTNPKTSEANRSFWLRFGDKYGHSPQASEAAPARMAEILRFLSTRLEQQYANGNKFFIANQLSALDVYWATFAALVQPLPPELCPMATAFRASYTEQNPVVTAALSPLLLQHRDFIYREYLELPVVF